MKLDNKIALITGAGSGIGRALAQNLSEKGCHLALVDIHPESLATTVNMVEGNKVNVSQHVTDVTDRKALTKLVEEVIGFHSGLHVLINNAGIAAGGTFIQLSETNFNKVMDVNFHAVVNLTRVVLPELLKQTEARIVNISSLFGLISPPEQTAYCASKFAVRGFSNALRFELEGSHVGVSVVHPGGINTNIAQSAIVPDDISNEEIEQRKEEEDKLLTMPPRKAAEIIIKGIEKNKPRILVGTDAKVISWLERLMPVSYWKIVGPVLEKKKKS